MARSPLIMRKPARREDAIANAPDPDRLQQRPPPRLLSGSAARAADGGFDETPAVPEAPAARPALLASLAEASTHLEKSALAARTLDALALAESIDSVGLQANDLMRRQLRGLRLAAGVTQAELARRVGSRPGIISAFETGKRPMPPAFVGLVSAALGGGELSHIPSDTSFAMRQARRAVAGEETRAFEVVASGISMEPSIRHGDRLLVSHEVALEAGRIVVATHDEVWIVKRLAMRDGALVLRSDNADEELALAAVDIQGVVVELSRTV